MNLDTASVYNCENMLDSDLANGISVASARKGYNLGNIYSFLLRLEDGRLLSLHLVIDLKDEPVATLSAAIIGNDERRSLGRQEFRGEQLRLFSEDRAFAAGEAWRDGARGLELLLTGIAGADLSCLRGSIPTLSLDLRTAFFYRSNAVGAVGLGTVTIGSETVAVSGIEAYIDAGAALAAGLAPGAAEAGWLLLPACGRVIPLSLAAITILRRRRTSLSFQDVPDAFEITGPSSAIRVNVLPGLGELGGRGQSNLYGWCRIEGRVEGDDVQEIGLLVLPAAGGSDLSAVIARANQAATAEVLGQISAGSRPALPSVASDIAADVGTCHDIDALVDQVALPLRVMASRSGKGWRGYTIALCCEAVGGDFSRHQHWLAFTEILHVSSLIIDDIQDDADARRGLPACHKIYGVPSTINAGNLGYFLALNIIDRTEINERGKCALYREYSDLLRYGHVGQGIDLGLIATPELLATAGNDLLSKVRYANRLKTGVPFRGAARVGAILGNAADQHTLALGRFFLEVGDAFQLVDDILNVTGIPGTESKRGEDIRNQKVTIPLLMTLDRLNFHKKAKILEAFWSAPCDTLAVEVVRSAIIDAGVIEELKSKIGKSISNEMKVVSPFLLDDVCMESLRDFTSRVLADYY